VAVIQFLVDMPAAGVRVHDVGAAGRHPAPVRALRVPAAQPVRRDADPGVGHGGAQGGPQVRYFPSSKRVTKLSDYKQSHIFSGAGVEQS